VIYQYLEEKHAYTGPIPAVVGKSFESVGDFSAQLNHINFQIALALLAGNHMAGLGSHRANTSIVLIMGCRGITVPDVTHDGLIIVE
jgi:hypothetical protein